MTTRLAAGLLLIGLIGPPASGPAEEPPAAWQPEGPSGAEGNSFRVVMTAAPTDLAVGERLLLTVRVTARGPWRTAPHRIDLRRLRAFRGFGIEPSASDRPDRESGSGKEKAWEFDYHLRPLDDSLRAIPGLAFRYYNPAVPFEDRRWNTIYAAAVPITVRPRAAVAPGDIAGAPPPPPLPAEVVLFSEGPSVLRRESPWAPPSAWLIVLPAVAPPLSCFIAYLGLRRWRPRAARKRPAPGSRAARRALDALARCDGRPENGSPAPVPIVANYLRERTAFAVVEGTPREVAAHLRKAGFSDATAARAADFFVTADAARFGPQSAPRPELRVDEARRLIQILEGEACSRPSS